MNDKRRVRHPRLEAQDQARDQTRGRRSRAVLLRSAMKRHGAVVGRTVLALRFKVGRSLRVSFMRFVIGRFRLPQHRDWIRLAGARAGLALALPPLQRAVHLVNRGSCGDT